MSVITTQGNTVYVLLGPCESCCVEFRPDGSNAHEGSKRLGLTLGMMHLPNHRSAMSIALPSEGVYEDRDTGTLVLLDASNKPTELVLAIGDQEMRLHRRWRTGLLQRRETP